MSIADYVSKHIPDYYPSMYLDGYSPEEILIARRKSMLAALDNTDEGFEVKIVSEVKKK